MPTFWLCGLPLSLPIRRIHWSCGPRLIVGGALSRSLSGETSLGTTTPSAALVRYLLASMVAPAGEALIAAMTCAAVLVIAPLAFVARLTVSFLLASVTLSGALRPSGRRAGRCSRCRPSWPKAFVRRTTVLAALAVLSAVVEPFGAW